jgi:hypothetical protein
MIRLATRPIVLTLACLVGLAFGLHALLAHERDQDDDDNSPPSEVGTLEGTFKGADSGDGTVPQQQVTVQGDFLEGNIQLSTANGDLFPLSPLEGWSSPTGHVALHSTSTAGTRLRAHGTMANDVMSLAFVVENEDGTIVDAGLMSLTLTLPAS